MQCLVQQKVIDNRVFPLHYIKVEETSIVVPESCFFKLAMHIWKKLNHWNMDRHHMLHLWEDSYCIKYRLY